MSKNSLIILTLIFSIYANGFADSDNLITGKPLILEYDVSYAGGKIAYISITESKPYEYQGEKVRELEARIESSGLFNINGFYRSIVSEKDYSVKYFKSDEESFGNKIIAEYWFDYNNHSARFVKKQISSADTIETSRAIENVSDDYFDSISLIFRLRDGLDTLSAPSYIPIFSNAGKDSVIIESISQFEFQAKPDSSLEVKLLKIRLPYKPFPGVGDYLEIYVSDDSDKAPVFAKLQMVMGFIEMRLR